MNHLLLILSSGLHYSAIIPTLVSSRDYRYIYSLIIFLSTTLSLILHLYEKEKSLLFYMNYSLSTMWTIHDILLTRQTHHNVVSTIFIYTTAMYFISGMLMTINNYQIWYELWHFISGIKCIYISYLLFHF